jgi:antitoxin (DNA-binding transcriptional repressor) of toxin-antitoxin stability system
MRFNSPAHEQPVARLTPHPASSNLILVNLMSISSFGWRKKMRRPVTKLNLLGHRPFWQTVHRLLCTKRYQSGALNVQSNG